MEEIWKPIVGYEGYYEHREKILLRIRNYK